MLKEVGASGQISLGKKYAGQLFELQVRPDGSILMEPVKVVPAATPSVQEAAATYGAPGESAAGGAVQREATRAWAEAHAREIDQYNAWASQREPYSQRVRRWREQGV